MKPIRSLPNIIIFILLLNLIFLSFLALRSQLIIFHDSIGYQNIAEMFAQGRFKEFFLTGPNREPLYSLLMACSIRLAHWQNMDYQAVQVLLQILILILSQYLTFKLLKKMNISDGACALTLAYMGFSPALTNSGLILFSEIITYPLVLWLVLVLSRAWKQLPTASITQNIRNGSSVALPAVLITLSKGAFELIVPIVLIPFLWKAFLAYRQRQTKMTVNVLVVIATIFCGLQLPIMAYKTANRHCNGVYALTDRAPEALYGNTARRMVPLSIERFRTALAYMTGPDICFKIYGERCLPWGFLASDVLGAKKKASLRDKGLTRQEINVICIQESIPYILNNPAQYFLMSLIEGSKTLFWEAPEISYVVYSDAVDKTYNAVWLRYPLRFMMALLCVCAIFWSGRSLWMNKEKLFTFNKDANAQLEHQFFFISCDHCFYRYPFCVFYSSALRLADRAFIHRDDHLGDRFCI